MRTPETASRWTSALAWDFDDDVGLVDRDGVRLGDVGALCEAERLEVGAGRDLDLVGADADGAGVEPGLAGLDVVLPAVPGAANDLAGPGVAVLAGRRRGDQAGGATVAERAALVRAAVADREVLAAEVEDADRAPGDVDDLPRPGRNLVDRRDDVLGCRGH